MVNAPCAWECIRLQWYMRESVQKFYHVSNAMLMEIIALIIKSNRYAIISEL